MSKSQRIELTEPPSDLTSEQASVFYGFTDKEYTFIKSRRGDHNRLGIAYQLCYFKYPGRLWRSETGCHPAILQFVSQVLSLDPSSIQDYASHREETQRRHIHEACTELNYTLFSEDHFQKFYDFVYQQSLQTGNGFALFASLLEELRKRRFIYSAISTVESFGRDILDSAEQNLYKQLTCFLSVAQQQKLDKLLDLKEKQLTYLGWLRQIPRRSSTKSLNDILDRLDYIRSFELPSQKKELFSANRLYQLSREGSRYKVSQLEGYDDLRRRALFVAFLLKAEEVVTDRSIDLFDKLVVHQFNKVEQKQFNQFQKDSKAINTSLKTYTKVGQALLKAKKQNKDLYKAVESTIGWDNLESSVDSTRKLTQKDDFEVVSGLDGRYTELRKFAPRFLESLQFKPTKVSESLLEAIHLLKKLNATNARNVPDDAPQDFVRRTWKKYVTQKKQINRHYYEWSVVSELRNTLRSGDLSVPSSHDYRDFESYLMDQDDYQSQKEKQTLPIRIELDFDNYIRERQAFTRKEIHEICPQLIAGELEGVSLEKGNLSISPLDGEAPKEAQALSDRLYNMLPKIKLTDLLVEVNGWVGFEKCFTHLYTGREVSDVRVLLTAILGDGINMSQSRMADATPEISRQQLIDFSKWYLREETYAQAIAEVTNMQHNHPFASHWGDGTTSSSDAQNYPIKDPRARVGDINLKYSLKSTLNYYTHLSDQYGPFFSIPIRSIVRDSPYVLDGLLYHESDLEIEEHFTDTGGFSDQVFGLCHLLGFRFSPRIRDLHDLKLYHFGEKSAYPELADWMGDEINVKRLKPHWDELLRIAASIRLGKVRASTILKKLSAYPRQNSLGWALRELGRIERSDYILYWIKSPKGRRAASIALNKGEGRNALARDVHHSGTGRVQDHSWERQLHRASGLCLITGCIILWNTVYLAKAVQTLRDRGEIIPDELLKHIAPVGWENINLGGEFLWNMSQRTTLDNLRDLRK